jgi:hypothetical protein
VQGVVALAIFDVHEGLRKLCEKVHHLEVTLLTRQMEGSGASLGAGIHLSHLLYQKLSHLHVVVKDGIMQRLLVLLMLVVHIGSLILVFDLIE